MASSTGEVDLIVRGWSLILAITLAFAATAQEAREPGATKTVGGIEFVWCPPGEFQQGATVSAEELARRYALRAEWFSDELPRTARTVAQGFWVSKTEITKSQWSAVMEVQPWTQQEQASAPDEPAVMMTWDEARDFARSFGNAHGVTARLPTETEWEYACRAGTDTAFSFGDEVGDLDRYVQFRLNVPTGQPQPVAKRGANRWGLHDVHGNVWEWCNDKYAQYGTGRDPAGAHFRVIRGGAVNGTAPFLRSSVRAGIAADTRSPRVGFRIVCEAADEE